MKSKSININWLEYKGSIKRIPKKIIIKFCIKNILVWLNIKKSMVKLVENIIGLEDLI